MGRYSKEQIQQVIEEVKQTGNVRFVAKKNNIPVSTVHTWLNKESKQNSNVTNIATVEKVKQLNRKLADKDLEVQILRDLLKKTYQIWPQD